MKHFSNTPFLKIETVCISFDYEENPAREDLAHTALFSTDSVLRVTRKYCAQVAQLRLTFLHRESGKDLVRAIPCSALIDDVAKICVETDFANSFQNSKIFAIIFGGRENVLFSHNVMCVFRR